MCKVVKSIAQIISVIFVSSLSLTACGGGGGGGGGGSGPSTSNVKGTGVRILHGAIDTAPVDLYSNLEPEKMIDSAFFGETTYYRSLSQGDQVLKILRALSTNNIVSTEQLSAEKDSKYTMLLYGDLDNIGLRTALIQDHKPELNEGEAAIRIVDGLLGASSVKATFDSTSLTDGIPLGSASSYVVIPAGIGTLQIKRTVDGKVLYSAPKSVESNGFYSYFITGQVDYLTVLRDLVD